MVDGAPINAKISLNKFTVLADGKYIHVLPPSQIQLEFGLTHNNLIYRTRLEFGEPFICIEYSYKGNLLGRTGARIISV